MAKKSTKSNRRKSSKSSGKPSRRPTKASKGPRKGQSAKGKPKAPKAAPKFKSPFPRDPRNSFREGSAYALTFDALAHAGEDGITRQDLVAAVAKVTRKDLKHAAYDVAVLLSARENGERHQSCRPGFWVERINDHLKLHVTAPSTETK